MHDLPDGPPPADLPPAERAHTGRLLVVDDDRLQRVLLADVLGAAGHEVETAADASEGLRRLEGAGFDAVLTDVNMPGMDGLALLEALRARGLRVPVMLMTSSPALPSAILAVERGALQYLVKPVAPPRLLAAVADALQGPRDPGARRTSASGLQAAFRQALDASWIAFQPIVRLRSGAVHAYEALVRSRAPALASPAELIDAAERLAGVHELGRAVRAKVAARAAAAPRDALLFVNLHPYDLQDPSLFDPGAPLSAIAPRVVLEVTERHALDTLPDVRERAAALRRLGYRLALDDMGSGHAGLPNLALLEPEVVKIDMSISRGVEERPRQQALVRSLAHLGAELGADVIAEGVETPAERDALLALGCELQQGYQFARPAEAFVVPVGLRSAG